ncbi:MAG: hypothetical protein A2Y25_09995 [Candidatus Melainabacteria bacterium GWF2_37_15]|nr:MAG: hypothetical protein A2Y25_09995 [Candidatus Melainabacteria bacterium GWF2_37_15]
MFIFHMIMIGRVNNINFNPVIPYKNTKSPSFGQIKPEMLFSDIDGFGKDYNWANSMIKVIDNSKSQNLPFEQLLQKIKEKYRDCFKNNARVATIRTNRENLSVAGRYEGYFDRAEYLVLKHYTKDYNDGLSHTQYAKFNPDIELITTDLNWEGYNLAWHHAPPESTLPVMKHIKKIYNGLNSQKDAPKDEKTLHKINKDIAEIHWYFTQLMPYRNGSAGITDVLTKTIYESLNIQVSPWKKGIAPDLEALVTPLDEFTKNYENYFTKPPYFMK